jgi:NitT/TauT family transport system substrate-binding protein
MPQRSSLRSLASRSRCSRAAHASPKARCASALTCGSAASHCISHASSGGSIRPPCSSSSTPRRAKSFLDELFNLAADGFDPRIIVVVDVSHGADVVVGRGGMRTMQDLKGKSVAVESSALGAFVLSRALALNNMQASDVQVVHLESNEQPSAFEKGFVDGAVTFDPYRAQFLRAGASTLFDSTQIPGEIVDVIAVRETMFERKPKGINALLGGWFGALDYMRSDPADAARRMGIRQQTSGEDFLKAQQGLHIPSREENLRMLGGPAPELAVTGRRLMSLMVESKLLRTNVDIENVLAPGPIANLSK